LLTLASLVHSQGPNPPIISLKEIAIPFHVATSSILAALQTLPSPKVGLYQPSPTSPTLRPIPISNLDYFHTPRPCLTFHSTASLPPTYPTTALGHHQTLQQTVHLSSTLEIRLDPSPIHQAYFMSGSEDVLSSSVADLQSANVLEGGKKDAFIGEGTCWDEFKIGYMGSGSKEGRMKKKSLRRTIP